MRWIFVLLFLYLIPLIILFKNYRNFRRSCIYSCIYIVLMTTIVISNVYISGLNKIKESMYYQNYALDSRYEDKYDSNFDTSRENIDLDVDKEVSNLEENKKTDEDNQEISNNQVQDSEVDQNIVEVDSNSKGKFSESDKKASISSSDLSGIFGFKKEIYNIERKALIPMRECMPYTRNISKNIKKLDTIKKDVVHARDMCSEVIDEYENMEINDLSDYKYTQVLYNARDDVKIAYELREKAMNSAIKLIDTKSPKYIGQITRYLDLSDKHIESFKERVEDLKSKVQENNNQ